MKKILTYGTFDLLHWGHINILKRAKEMGDYLVVGLSSDEFSIKLHNEARYSFDQRCYVLSSLKDVNEVIEWNSYEEIKSKIIQMEISTLVMPKSYKEKLNFLKEYCQIEYLD